VDGFETGKERRVEMAITTRVAPPAHRRILVRATAIAHPWPVLYTLPCCSLHWDESLRGWVGGATIKFKS